MYACCCDRRVSALYVRTYVWDRGCRVGGGRRVVDLVVGLFFNCLTTALKWDRKLLREASSSCNACMPAHSTKVTLNGLYLCCACASWKPGKKEKEKERKREQKDRESKRQEDGDEKCRLAINSSATRKQYQSCRVITICRVEYFNYFWFPAPFFVPRLIL